MKKPSLTSDVAKPAKRPYQKIWPVVVLLVAAVMPMLSSNPFYLHIAIMICLNIVFIAGLAIIARVGQLSLCHAAFVGIGAYTSVILTMRLGWAFPLAFLASGIVPAILAVVLGWVILRLRGVYFVLVTFAFGEFFRLLLLAMPSVTGGANGIAGVPAVAMAGLEFGSKTLFYPLALIAAVAAIAFNWRLFKSPLGKRFDAVESQWRLAESTGVNTYYVQIIAFMLGCAMAGFGGSLMAHYIGYVSPESFNFWLSVDFIIMLVIGGRLSVWGPVVGAIVLTPLPELLRGTLELQHVIYGVVLIAALRFMPWGVASLPGRVRSIIGSGGESQ